MNLDLQKTERRRKVRFLGHGLRPEGQEECPRTEERAVSVGSSPASSGVGRGFSLHAGCTRTGRVDRGSGAPESGSSFSDVGGLVPLSRPSAWAPTFPPGNSSSASSSGTAGSTCSAPPLSPSSVPCLQSPLVCAECLEVSSDLILVDAALLTPADCTGLRRSRPRSADNQRHLTPQSPRKGPCPRHLWLTLCLVLAGGQLLPPSPDRTPGSWARAGLLRVGFVGIRREAPKGVVAS